MSETRDAPGTTMAVLLGGQSPPGLGCTLGFMAFSQSCWCHSCPLFVSYRPAAGPGASSTPC